MTPQQLKQARIDAGLTQEQMARELRIGTSTLRMLENSKGFSKRQHDNIELRFAAWKAQNQQGVSK